MSTLWLNFLLFQERKERYFCLFPEELVVLFVSVELVGYCFEVRWPNIRSKSFGKSITTDIVYSSIRHHFFVMYPNSNCDGYPVVSGDPQSTYFIQYSLLYRKLTPVSSNSYSLSYWYPHDCILHLLFIAVAALGKSKATYAPMLLKVDSCLARPTALFNGLISVETSVWLPFRLVLLES